MSKFRPEPAQNQLPPWLLRRPPRARRIDDMATVHGCLAPSSLPHALPHCTLFCLCSVFLHPSDVDAELFPSPSRPAATRECAHHGRPGRAPWPPLFPDLRSPLRPTACTTAFASSSSIPRARSSRPKVTGATPPPCCMTACRRICGQGTTTHLLDIRDHHRVHVSPPKTSPLLSRCQRAFFSRYRQATASLLCKSRPRIPCMNSRKDEGLSAQLDSDE
jgi:hypothetical protein